MCFFFGGLNYQTQRFNANGARTQYSLLLLAILALVGDPVVAPQTLRDGEATIEKHGSAVQTYCIYIYIYRFFC